MDAIERFVLETVRFRDWALTGTDRDVPAAREALLRIASLYLAALALPRPWSPELTDGVVDGAGRNAEWKSVYTAAARLPLQYYGEVFDPLPVPPESPIVADLADDIADIYCDVVCGLRLHEAGHQAEALWEWGYNFAHHWGEHATAAIRALHCFLMENDPDAFPPSS